MERARIETYSELRKRLTRWLDLGCPVPDDTDARQRLKNDISALLALQPLPPPPCGEGK